jgi:hypothetical protein
MGPTYRAGLAYGRLRPDKLSLSGAGFIGHYTTSAQPELVEGRARTKVLNS